MEPQVQLIETKIGHRITGYAAARAPILQYFEGFSNLTVNLRCDSDPDDTAVYSMMQTSERISELLDGALAFTDAEACESECAAVVASIKEAVTCYNEAFKGYREEFVTFGQVQYPNPSGISPVDSVKGGSVTEIELSDFYGLSGYATARQAVSHEIGTPLSAILTSMHLVEKKPWDRKKKENAKVQTEELVYKMRGLSTYAQLVETPTGTGEFALDRAFNGFQIPFRVAEIENRVAQFPEIRFDLRATAEVKTLFEQSLANMYVLRELINNSLKFGGSDIVATVEIDAQTSAFYIKVEDNGGGMEPAFAERATYPMEKEDKQRHNRFPFNIGFEGAGLGLSIMREVVRIKNGDYRIDTEKGNGTTVQIKLPIAA